MHPQMSAPPTLPSESDDMTNRHIKSLERIYELTSGLMNVENVNALLTRICESVREIYGFDLVHISMLDDKSQVFSQHAMAGYSEADRKELDASPKAFAHDEIISDLREDCKLSRATYFVPVEKQNGKPEEFVLVRDPDAARKPRPSPDSWHELDLLYFALMTRSGNLIGYMQVDYPQSGRLPSLQSVREMELFANLAAVAIENHNMYRRVSDLFQENELKTTRIQKILDLLRSVLRVDDLDIVLQKVSDSMALTFGFRKTGVSIFTKGSNRVTVHALTGYTEEEEQAVRSSMILRSVVLSDFKEVFRVTKTGYFVPGEKQGSGSDFVFIETPDKARQARKSPDSWHELDLLYFGLYDRDGNILGYIQLDYPEDGKIPTKESMEMMEAYASIAGIAVENSSMFKEAEDAKTQVKMYLDLLTHDVGNLVNPVNAYLEVVMGTTELSPIQHRYLSSAQEAARSITHLVRNVRRSAQMLETSGGELVPTSLTKSIRQTAADSRSAYVSKKIDIDLVLPEHEVYVMADSFLDEVLYNLLTNAIKYDEHDEIIVDVELSTVDFEGRKHAKVVVADRGIGIPDEFKDKVFTRDFRKLVRPDRPILQKSRGAGMGLVLVKTLVERYGGKVWVENRVYDDSSRGSMFCFILPLP